ncbi:MAG: hypothetical protein ACRDCG_01820 [Mycoplasmoidaceae bacterium]
MKSKANIIAPVIKGPVYDFGFGKHDIFVKKLPISNQEYKKKVDDLVKNQNIPLKNAEVLVQTKVIEVESFNQIMDYISSLFNFEFDKDELTDVINKMKNNESINNLDSDSKSIISENLAKKVLMKNLIFSYFVKNYNQLDVSLKEAEFILRSNKKISDKPTKREMEEIAIFRENNIENKIIDWLLRQYRIVINLDNKNLNKI